MKTYTPDDAFAHFARLGYVEDEVLPLLHEHLGNRGVLTQDSLDQMQHQLDGLDLPVDVNHPGPPEFNFHTEVGALRTLEDLGSQLQELKAQEARIRLHMRAAVDASQRCRNGDAASQRAIEGATGLSSPAVCDMLYALPSAK